MGGLLSVSVSAGVCETLHFLQVNANVHLFQQGTGRDGWIDLHPLIPQ
jgi:hypothetical protein